MTSYYSLINKIEVFCNAHLQIKKFAGEFKEQMPNFATMDEKYPIVFLSHNSASDDLELNQFTVDLYCVDIIQKDRENINTILSDTHLILTDLYLYFKDGDYEGVDVIGVPTLTPLNNFDLDYVAGWVMTITLEVQTHNVCEIPMGEITPVVNTCDPATYTITDDEANVLYSGSILSGGSLTQVIQDSTAVLKDSAGSTISTTSINAEGSSDITAPDGVVTITDDSANVLHTVNVKSNGTASQIITDSTVTNSDVSYSVTVNAEGSLVLPDSQLNVNSVNEGNVVSVKTIDVNVTDGVSPVTPDSVGIVGNTVTIQVPASSPPTSVLKSSTLMKTGQTTSYRTGDDGDLQAGRATDFLTLDTIPVHADGSATANTTTARFTDELGGQTYTNNIVIDWSTYDNVAETVLGVSKNLLLTNNITWAAAIDYALAYSVGSFTTGWRLWNYKEFVNFFNANYSVHFGYPPFNNLFTIQFWTSTVSTAGQAYVASATNVGTISALLPTGASGRALPVRTFTVSGTSLT